MQKSYILSAFLGLSSATISKGRCPEMDSGFTSRVENLNIHDLDRKWFYIGIDRDYMKTPDGAELPRSVVPECIIADTFCSLDQFRKLRHKN